MYVAGAIVDGGRWKIGKRGEKRGKAWINTSIRSGGTAQRRLSEELVRACGLSAKKQRIVHLPRDLPSLDLSLKIITMISSIGFFLTIIIAIKATVYLPLIKEEQLLTDDTLLRELINQMGNELADVADSYLGYQEKPKEVPVELPMDYDGIDTLNPNPSIRDQEYLQHSTLWSHQRANDNDKSSSQYRIKPGFEVPKPEKSENTLPAYCTPPNPCPVGYTSENNCIVDFENTAAFSQEYQSAQDCMCDTEHMLDCSVESSNSNSLSGMRFANSNFNQIVEQLQKGNPFFRGEKLPIAAKKGINVIY